MDGYLLDSNHANRLIDPRHPTRVRLLAAMAQSEMIYITPPVIAETVFSFSILPRAQRNLTEWQAIRPALRALMVDEADAMNAASLQALLRRQGWQIKTVDTLIAVAALRYDLTLLTTDGDFVRVPALVVENWVPQ